MVQAIAQLARAMSLTTVAEYVETDEIRTRITALGVDYGQGFAIGRPVPLADVVAELPLYVGGGASERRLAGQQRRMSRRRAAGLGRWPTLARRFTYLGLRPAAL